MPRRPASRQSETPIDELLGALSREQLVEIVAAAVDRHDDVERAARLVAARKSGALSQLRSEVDRGLRTRRFLDYREAMTWAQAGQPVVAELDQVARDAPSAELVALLQRAIGHVVKVIHHADDSSGLIGDLVRALLDIHATACDAGVADPIKLAAWMIRFRFVDQDFFEVDPVRYAAALGERGIAAYRKAVDDADGVDSFALRYAQERLAVLDGDIDALIKLAGGDLTNAYQFFRVAEAMAEIGREDLVLHWTGRGIAEMDGWQLGSLYDLACQTLGRLEQPLEVLRLRRAHHERMPSSSTYSALRKAADTLDAWELECDAARAALEGRDPRGFIDVLLADGDARLAWDTATRGQPDELDANLWLRLADTRAADHPADALAVYQRVVDEVLVTTDRRAYASAVRILKRARAVAKAAGELATFTANVARIREAHRRRPTLIKMLDKAGLFGA